MADLANQLRAMRPDPNGLAIVRTASRDAFRHASGTTTPARESGERRIDRRPGYDCRMADRRKRIVSRAYDRIAGRYLDLGGTIEGDPRHALLTRFAGDLGAGAGSLSLDAGLVFRLRRS